MENDIAIAQKMNINQPNDPAFLFLGYLPKRNENIWSQKDLYINVHRSFIHNSPTVELNQMIEYSSAIKRNKLHATTW